MIKVYSLLFSILLSINLSAGIDPTFTVTTLVPNAEGIIYTKTVGNSSIEVKIGNYTQQIFPGSLNLPCLSSKVFTDYSFLLMTSGTTSSYLEIKNTGEAHIEKVVFTGYGDGGESRMLCGGSKDGVYYMDTYEDPNDWMNTYTKALSFSATPDDACANESDYTYTIMDEAINYMTGITETGLRDEIKYIRLNWADGSFGGQSLGSGKGKPLNLFGLKVYTNAVVVGIENIQKESLTYTYNSEYLSFSEDVNVEIYSLSGALVLHTNNTTEISLSALNKGAYIIKAKSLQSGASLVKKILR